MDIEPVTIAYDSDDMTTAYLAGVERGRDASAAEITALRKRVEELEGALEYARPIIVRYGHTQGDRADYHADLVAPIDAALRAKGGGDAHPDDLAVDRFADAMKAKLAQKRAEGRGGWEDKNDCSSEWLSGLLRGHVDKGDPVDVANFAMMLHQRGERIAP